jgi:branched-chain amino acid transport system permease protein
MVAIAAALVLGAAIAGAPFFLTPYVIAFLLIMFMYLSMAASWNLLTGFTGYPSFGHTAFFGIGAYVAAILITRLDVAWPVAALAGGLGACIGAAAVGIIVLRLRGVYFAIVTLGLAETLRVIAQTWESMTGGGWGISLPPTRDLWPFYYAMVGLGVAGVLMNFIVARSNFGLRLMAIREDEDAAAAIGVNTTWCKIAAFILSAALPGVAGGVYARYISYIDPPTVFSVLVTIQIVTMTLFGGAGTVLGPIVGVIVLSVLGEVFWANFPFFHRGLYGLMIIGIIFLMPQGVVEVLKARRLIKRSRSI